MTFTPSATNSFSAGAVFWGMIWATLGKLNELAHFVGFKRANPRQTVLRWINAHKVVTITLTEADVSRMRAATELMTSDRAGATV
jgi:hypothetical protein